MTLKNTFIIKTEYDINTNIESPNFDKKILLKKLANDKYKNSTIIYNDCDLRGYLPFIERVKQLNESGYNITPFLSIDLKNNKSVLIKTIEGIHECLDVFSTRKFEDKQVALTQITKASLSNLMLVETNNLSNLSLNSFVSNPLNILESFRFTELGSLMPIYNNQEKQSLLNPQELINYLITKLNDKKIPQELRDVYVQRINKEIAVFNNGTKLNKDFIPYMLLMSDIVQKANDLDIITGKARGSSAGSLVAYLLDINKIDPIEYNLSFERFLNPNRKNFVDIDLDIQADKLKTLIENIKTAQNMNYFVASVRSYNSYSFNDLVTEFKKLDFYKNNQETQLFWDNILSNVEGKLKQNPEQDRFTLFFNEFKKQEGTRSFGLFNSIKSRYTNGETLKQIFLDIKNKHPEFELMLIELNKDLFKLNEEIKDKSLQPNDIKNLILSSLDRSYNVFLFKNYQEYLMPVNKLITFQESYKNLTTNAASKIILNKNQLNDLKKIAQVDFDNNEFIVSANKDVIEKIGLVKFDLLAVKNLSIIDYTNKKIGGKIEIPYKDIKSNQLAINTVNFLAKNELSTIFQMNSPIMKIAIKKTMQDLINNNYQGDIIKEISNILAIVRPGTLSNDSVLNYLQNKNNDFIDNFDSTRNSNATIDFNEKLRCILKDTRQNIIYQEQVMEIVQLLGFNGSEADDFRRAISKKDAFTIEQCREKFNQLSFNFIDNGNIHDINYFNSLFDKVKNLAEYTFNKSHSISYAQQVWENSYLAANYSKEFIEASIQINSGNLEGMNKSSDFIGKMNQICYLAGELGYGLSINNENESSKIIEGNLILGKDVIKDKINETNLKDMMINNKNSFSLFFYNTVGNYNYKNNVDNFVINSVNPNLLKNYINTLDGGVSYLNINDNNMMESKITNVSENNINNKNLYNFLSTNFDFFVENNKNEEIKIDINKIDKINQKEIKRPDLWDFFE